MDVATAAVGDLSESTSWLVRRALLAIALMAGFYVLALTLALGLLWIPYAEWIYVGQVSARILIGCVSTGLVVLWAIIPRIDRFEAPGPRLDETSAPQLLAMVREVADKTKQEAPSEIYLLNDVNAWVTQRGGIMGFGSRRVMGVGLPLIQILTQDELKGVIAHEFGHYCAGDVAVGPWIYKTRSAIARTLSSVHDTLLEKPFLWYGRFFLRLTHAVSRRQEFVADSIAAKVTTPSDVANALRRITVAAPAFASYLNQEVVPVLRFGFLPPIAAGFPRFLSAEQVKSRSTQMLADAESRDHSNPFDTHPSLRDRLAALGNPEGADISRAQASAVEILCDFDELATMLSHRLVGGDAAQFKPISWDRVGEDVIGAKWRETAKRNSAWLSKITADTIPNESDAYLKLASDMSLPEEMDRDQQRSYAVYVVMAGLAALLMERGWKVDASFATPASLVCGSDRFEISALQSFVTGATTVDEWKARCTELGLTGQPLGCGK